MFLSHKKRCIADSFKPKWSLSDDWKHIYTKSQNAVANHWISGCSEQNDGMGRPHKKLRHRPQIVKRRHWGNWWLIRWHCLQLSGLISLIQVISWQIKLLRPPERISTYQSFWLILLVIDELNLMIIKSSIQEKQNWKTTLKMILSRMIWLYIKKMSLKWIWMISLNNTS